MLVQAQVGTPLLLEANAHSGSVDSGLIAFPVYGHTIDRSVIGGQGRIPGLGGADMPSGKSPTNSAIPLPMVKAHAWPGFVYPDTRQGNR